MIARPDVPRSTFSGSWTRKTTFDAGFLVPFLVEEILPGDHMRYQVTAYVRLQTPLFPIFDNQRIDTFFFFVPNRLVWDNWVKFMGEQADPTDTIAYTIPQIVSAVGGFVVNGIYDHMGLPTVGQVGGGSTVSVNVLPFRAYNLIFQEWFRDQNVVSAGFLPKGNGPDTLSWFLLRRRAKAHDYFTACLPWPQKFTAPTVPVAGLAPITGLGLDPGSRVGTVSALNFVETGGATQAYAFVREVSTDSFYAKLSAAAGAEPQIYANLAAATGVSVNEFRRAFLIQQLLERDARGGTRYIELVKSHFGVTSPDHRHQRPEYIGGGSTPLTITPVAQTAPTTGLTVGALGAAGTASGSHSASYAATEHGFIIGLINVRSELSYQQGLNKMWSRSTRFDYYWPSLAGLGEQAVLRKELFITGIVVDDDIVFGYQERWHEYRTRTSEVTGMFKSTTAGTIHQWHLSQQIAPAPVLGQTFIEDTPPMIRVLAAGSAANNMQYLADILISRTATRPIPSFGTPVALGRF